MYSKVLNFNPFERVISGVYSACMQTYWFCADWEKSGKALRVGITGYFYDKPAYQRPVEEISAALVSKMELFYVRFSCTATH